MRYKITSKIDNIRQFDCLVCLVLDEKIPKPTLRLNNALSRQLSEYLEQDACQSTADGKRVHSVNSQLNQSIIVLDIKSKQKITINYIVERLDEILNDLESSKKRSVLVCVSELRPKKISKQYFYQLLIQNFETSLFDIYTKNDLQSEGALEGITFFEPRAKSTNLFKKSIKIGLEIAKGINLSKQMSNLPANLCTPTYLANKAVSISENTAIRTKVFDEAALQALNMNCFLAVSKGSEQPAKLIEMCYYGGRKSDPPIVLIGKGLTFDSGGYSIKSAAQMDEMKFDMCGGACVIALMSVIAQLHLRINVITLVPCSENLINGQAFKPGDVLSSLSGQTVEILSTDAEGRLLIADCLSYAQKFNPNIVIDVATLTGAAITALGYDLSAIMSNDHTLTQRLIKAGQLSNDNVWPLPLWDEYSEILKSNFADMASSAGRDGGSGAGAIVAASFLSEFVSKYRWAHLDVAGTAWRRGKNKGATGRPVALLSQFLISYAEKRF